MFAKFSIEQNQVQMFIIEGAKDLDPIRVIIEDLEPGRGRMIIVCWDAAWTGYWGAMSGRDIAAFVVDCDAEYLAGNFMSASGLSRARNHRAYLIRVIEAVRAALRPIVKKTQ